MASLQSFPSYFATGLIMVCVIGLTHFKLPLCSSALRQPHEAGNSSFIAEQDGSFWSSDAGNYSFGFSSTSEEGHEYLLSIWHSEDPNRTPLWWPGLANPIVKFGSTLNFTINGSLELHNPQGTLLWSSNSSASYAHLKDTGNLALLEKDGTSLSWQSFHDPRDSLMLSDLQESIVASKSLLLQSRSNASSFAPGIFHIATDWKLKLYFHSFDSLHNDFVYLQDARMNTSNGLQVLKHRSVSFSSTSSANELQRMTLDYDGNLRVYMWASNISAWKEVWQMVDDKCMLGSPCGPFGICQEVGSSANGLNCSCPPGYGPRDAGDISQGCESLISFNPSCGTHNTTNYNTSIEEVPESDYNYNDLHYQRNVSLNACKLLCLNDCKCMAASYRNDGVCFLKGNSTVGYLLNGYASTTNTLLIKVVKTVSVANDKQGRQWVIGVGVGAVILAVVLGVSSWFLSRRKATAGKRRRSHEFKAEGPVKYFAYEELVEATNNFGGKLGEGGFGVVYKGWIKGEEVSGLSQNEKLLVMGDRSNGQIAVAVKLLKGDAMDEEREGAGHGSAEMQFRAEVKTLGKIHHVNLVSLLGYCSRRRRAEVQRLLVFEYMENGSLDKFLACSEHEQLPWATRYSIALGAARGIAYLHHECSPPIMHCDIKPHNILLDNQFTAKVADFGFARRFHGDSHITMSGIRGTRGYLAPEWLTSQELTSKVDVYSFGMLLLELVRGFKSADEINCLPMEWAMGCISEGVVGDHHHQQNEKDEPKNTFSDLVSSTEDRSLESKEAAQKLQVLKVGMWCIQPNPSTRPAMSRVVQLIDGTLPVEDPPLLHSSLYYVVPRSTATTGTSEISYSVVSGR